MAVSALRDYRPKPHAQVAVRWAQDNLFDGVWNTLLTIATTAFVLFALYQVLQFVLVDAVWEVVNANRGLFFIGRFPRDEVWRIWAIVHIISGLTGLSWGLWSRIGVGLGAKVGAFLVLVYIFMLDGDALLWTTTSIALFGVCYLAARWLSLSDARDAVRNLTVAGWIAGFVTSMYILSGVPTRLWGGFMLTMVLAIVGIVGSFPLGVLLAVGRQSTFPVIRLFCIGYIELIRGVPLITVLFMALFILPFALEPERRVAGILVTGVEPDIVVRAMIGIILFTAAYVAETVRGGLQAVPRSQIEAAQALGLGGVRILALIVLPQALRAVIPAMVGQFISLFKDTSLVFILGLTDLLRVASTATAQPGFIGRHAEVFLFAALIYWVVAYSMSQASQRLEQTLGVGER